MKKIFLLVLVLLLVALNPGVASGEENSTRKVNLTPKEKGICTGGLIFLPEGIILVKADNIIVMGPDEFCRIKGCNSYSGGTIPLFYERYESDEGEIFHEIQCLDVPLPEIKVLVIDAEDVCREQLHAGDVYLKQGRYDDATEAFTNVIQSTMDKNNFARACRGLAKVLYEMGNYFRASVEYSISLIGLEPDPSFEDMLFIRKIPTEATVEGLLIIDLIWGEDFLGILGTDGRGGKIRVMRADTRCKFVFDVLEEKAAFCYIVYENEKKEKIIFSEVHLWEGYKIP